MLLLTNLVCNNRHIRAIFLHGDFNNWYNAIDLKSIIYDTITNKEIQINDLKNLLSFTEENNLIGVIERDKYVCHLATVSQFALELGNHLEYLGVVNERVLDTKLSFVTTTVKDDGFFMDSAKPEVVSKSKSNGCVLPLFYNIPDRIINLVKIKGFTFEDREEGLILTDKYFYIGIDEESSYKWKIIDYDKFKLVITKALVMSEVSYYDS